MHLSAAQRHAEQGDSHIQTQKRIIADFLKLGIDTIEAERLLALFELTQQNHLNHVDRLLDLLGKMPLVGSGDHAASDPANDASALRVCSGTVKDTETGISSDVG